MRDFRSSHSTPAPRNADRRTSNRKGDVRPNPTAKRGHARRPKLPLRETLAILRVIATRRATIAELTRAVRMSRATVYRLLTGCKRDLGMRIECESRVFKLRDWGLLNRRKVLK
ncbi:MAG: helix-turn-helix domain-containing protein [Proteobacteria bacterium]|nr:helix-turn-helix domain-containing protein [Pseudomonadota bacterium]